MGYKKSIYNFTYTREPDQKVIYNTYTKAVIVLNDEEFAQYQAVSMTDPESEKALVENGIFIEDNFDEKDFLRYCHYRTKFAHEVLHLIIAPTMDCNFGCPYCYENRRTGKMTKEIQDGVIAYINKMIGEGVKNLEITWYGGEPLLFPDIVESLSRRIIAIAKEHDCVLNMYMVTNGYLLTQELVDLLDELEIMKVQITIDGMKANHDARRHLRNGKGTFDKILENLKLFQDSPIRVDIRMNVDNQNCVDYQDLVTTIAALDNPNMGVYPSPVEDINKDKVNEVSDFMTQKEFEKFATGLQPDDTAPQQSSVMEDRYCFCNAETENCYVIDERGNCYKCWDQVGREEYVCFNVLDPQSRNYRNITAFMAWDPLADEKCGDCIFLPLCFGGCKFHRMNNHKTDCGFSFDALKHFVESTYF